MTLFEALTVATAFAGVLLTTIIYLHTRRSGILHDIRAYIERLDTVGGRSVHALESRMESLEATVARNSKRIDRIFERRSSNNDE